MQFYRPITALARGLVVQLLVSVVCFILTLGMSSSHAFSVNLDSAQGFNVFVAGDFDARFSATGGRLAAGNNATLRRYNINGELTGQPSLVVGNVLTYREGGVVGGTTQGNGQIEVGGTATFQGVTYGSLSNNVSVDFASAFTALNVLSSDLAGASATGSQSINGSGELTYSGDGVNGSSSHQIFNVTVQQFQNALSFNVINVDAEDTLIFNVAGLNPVFKNNGNYAGGASNSFAIRSRAQRVIYNFYEASTVTLDSEIYGSVLSPNAQANCAGGELNGQLVVARVDCASGRQTEFSFLSFMGIEEEEEEVPSPASLSLVLLGLCGLVLRRKYSCGE